jgi:hypothetical protein
MVSYVRVLEVAGRTGDASRGAEKAFAICERLSRDHQLDASTQAVLAGTHLGVAIVLGGSGSSSTVRKIPQAIQNDQAALSLLGAIHETQNPLVQSLNVKVRFFLAFHLNKARRFRESEQLFDEVIAAANPHPFQNPFLKDYSNRVASC